MSVTTTKSLISWRSSPVSWQDPYGIEAIPHKSHSSPQLRLKTYKTLIEEPPTSESRSNEIFCQFLSQAGIQHSPPELKNLASINLFHKKITVIPDEIRALTNLHELDLRLNQLTELPSSLIDLTQLRIINLEGNRFAKFPEVLKKMDGLQAIYIDRNPLTEIPVSMLEKIQSKPSWSKWGEG